MADNTSSVQSSSESNDLVEVIARNKSIGEKISSLTDKRTTCSQLLSFVSQLYEINTGLLTVIEKMCVTTAQSQIELRTYASVTAAAASSSNPRSDKDTPKALADVNERLDTVEQESLANVVSCQGNVVKSLIDENNREKTAGILKKSFIKLVKDKCKVEIKEDVITSVQVRGKENAKHLRVEFANKSLKIDLLRTVRSLRPEDLYVSDYLTAARSKLFFELRQLKKNSSQIKSVFPWKGVLKCRMNDDKFIQVCCQRDFDSFKSKLTVNDSDS